MTVARSDQPGRLEVTVIRSFQGLRHVAGEWDAFVERAESDIYFVTDWLEAFWSHYGKGRRLRCFLIRLDGEVIAALPFSVEKMGLGPFGVRLARFVGADSTIPVFCPAILPGHEAEVMRAVLGYLLEEERCHCVSLSPLSGLSKVPEAVRRLASGDGAIRVARDCSRGPHTYFSLPEDFETFLAGLSKKMRGEYRRGLKQIAKLHEVEPRVIEGAESVSRFDQFVALHQAQWAQAGRLGHFGDWPGSAAFNRDLVERLAEGGRAKIYAIFGDGEPLTMEFGFALGRTFYWRLPARVSDPALEKLGLGRIGLLKMIETLCAEGVRHIEAGPGHYPYKLRCGGAEAELTQLIVTSSSPVSRLMTRAVIGWSELVNLAYYKAWFLKLAPKVPFLHAPLWRGWIRTRL